MTITVFADVIMPNSVLSAGVRGKNMRKNERAMNQGGFASANVVWSRTLRQYELGTVPMLVSQWAAIEGLHEVTEGGAYGFLMQDPKDNTVAASEGVLMPIVEGYESGTAGLGAGVPTYQLSKRYTSAGSTRTKDRSITRPNSVSLFRNGSPVTIGVGPGNASIDTTTGRATFVADTTKSVNGLVSRSISAITKANPGVITTSVAHGFATGDRIYISGVGGMTQLTPAYYTITVVDATRFSIGVDTSAYTTFTSGGTAELYGITKTNLARVNCTAHGFTNGQVIYITGAVGMTQVNDLSFIVANATTNYFELSGIDASAFSTYSGSAVISKFPQSTDAITWSGSFYVPVHFVDDEIEWDMVRAGQFDSRMLAGPSVVLVEVRE